MDIIDIEILEDGTISVKTDKVSQTNHHSADEFIAEMEKLAGSKRETTKTKQGFMHTHTKKHQHHHH